MTLPVFPLSPLTHPAFSVHRRPTFATIDHISKQGRGTGAAQQNAPLWEFELSYELLRDATQNIAGPLSYTHLANKTELQQILQLNLACAGQYGEFLFLDSTDNSREFQTLGIGDGETLEFPFVRSIIGVDDLAFTEQVGAVNLNFSVVVYLDGISVAPGPSTWGVSTDQLTLVFITAPADGVVVSSTFHYYYRCRWISDSQEVEQFAQFIWSSASVRFRSVDPKATIVEPIEIPIIEPPVPPTPTNTNCLHDFQWVNHLGAVGSSAPVQSAPTVQGIDVNGNLWIWETLSGSNRTRVYGPNGALLATHSDADLADAIDDWYGGSIVGRGPGYTIEGARGFSAKPIKNGEYFLVYIKGAGPSHLAANWFAVLDATVDGSLNVVGACFSVTITGPPFGASFNILDVANGKSSSDPILYIGGSSFGGFIALVVVLPSIDDMSTPMTGFGLPCQIPTVALWPIGNMNLSTFFGWSAQGLHCKWSGFILPNSDDETILYAYFSRGYTDFAIPGNFTADKEVQLVLGPAYPFGCIVKINLGEIDFFTLAGTPHGTFPGGPTPMYSVDNANWRLSGGAAQIPFTDEYTYISHGNNAGGTDVYEMQPAAIIPRDGKYWVFFYMIGLDDRILNADGQLFETFRLFEFDPATEIATQILKDTCLLHKATDVTTGVASSSSSELFQAMSLIDEDDGSITIVVHGSIYKTLFYNFTI